MEKFDILFQIGEGTYGKVMKAVNKETQKFVAIKKIKNIETIPQIKKIAYREIKILKSVKHPNIVSLEEVISNNGSLFLIFEFVDCNLLELLNTKSRGIPLTEIKSLVYQTAKALQHCHSMKIIHRDIKPENLLVSKQGHLKVCDFGFARSMRSFEALTEYVSTRWYRSPELLVRSRYNFSIDVWALGCLTYEMFTSQPLFPGSSDIDTLSLIIKTCGSLPVGLQRSFNTNPVFQSFTVISNQLPKSSSSLDNQLSNFPKDLADFIKICIELDPEQRVSVDQLIGHHFFEEISQESSKRTRRNYFSPYKSRQNLQYLSNSPAFARKVSPSKENEGMNKIREEGYRKYHEKLPNIKHVIETRKKEMIEVQYPISKSRYGAKSTMKGGYLEKDQLKKKYSLLPNQSNESLVKFSFHNQSTSIRNKPVFDNGIGYSGASSKNFSKKNVSKLDLSFLSKNMGVSGIFYASSRK